mmetsp:Transcript_16429/g.53491  ORF Transcript_16429/g.53491 Transcript_16429/m.53491 type:complete len:240 (+) Transcript_16429:24-743(+)
MRSSSFPLVLATAAAFSFPAAAPALRRRPPRLSLLYAEEDKAFPPSNEEIDVEKEPLKKEEPFWVYLVGKPGELDADLRLLGTSRRRILEAVSLAAVIALAGDFLGMTSALLSAAPDQARTLRLDSYYGVRGLRRYVDDEERLEFLYPEPWLADRDVYLSRRQSPEEAFLSSKKKILRPPRGLPATQGERLRGEERGPPGLLPPEDPRRSVDGGATTPRPLRRSTDLRKDRHFARRPGN